MTSPSNPTTRSRRRTRLTSRGVGVLIAGAAMLFGGVLGAIAGLAIIGGAVLILVAAATVIERLQRGPGPVQIVAAPSPTAVGSTTDVALYFAHLPAARLAQWDLQIEAPPALGGPVAVAPGHTRAHVSPVRRGLWQFGPVIARRTEPAGLVGTTCRQAATFEILVHPRVVEISAPTLGQSWEARAGAVTTTNSPDDAIIREYVTGDDPRRVHWSSTARRSKLMVRTPEGGRSRTAALLIDTSGPPPRVEWAIEAAAAAGVSLIAAGWPVRVITGRVETAGVAAQPHGAITNVRRFLDVLALIPTTTRADVARAAADVSALSDDLVLGVLGRLDGALSAVLSRRQVAGRGGLLLYGPASVTEDELAAAGWLVHRAEPQLAVAEAWDRLLAPKVVAR